MIELLLCLDLICWALIEKHDHVPFILGHFPFWVYSAYNFHQFQQASEAQGVWQHPLCNHERWRWTAEEFGQFCCFDAALFFGTCCGSVSREARHLRYCVYISFVGCFGLTTMISYDFVLGLQSFMAHWGDSATAVYVHVCVCASFTCSFFGLALVSFKQHLLLHHIFVVESFAIGRRTWSEVYARSRQLCSALKGRGISRGDVTWHFRWKTDPKCQHLWSGKMFEWWKKIKCTKRTET